MATGFTQSIARNRPAALKHLDQVHMTAESTQKTCKSLAPYMERKKLIFIGDDDLMSLRFSRFCSPRSATVLDIDERILSHIRRNATQYGFAISTRPYNVLEDLPQELKGSADFFYTNPPYGSKNKGDSCKAFALRGIECLSIGGHGAIVIGSGAQHEWAMAAEASTLEFVEESGCRIVGAIKDFQGYEGNPIRSSMFVIRKERDASPNKDFLRGIQLY